MIDLREYGVFPEHLPQGAAGEPARVTAVHRERYELICAAGERSGRLKTAAYYGGGELFPTVGDEVLIDGAAQEECRILRTLPRRTVFVRREPGPVPREQAVAANFDEVLILQSLNRDFNLHRLERYLAQAWQSGASPVVVLTKADLAAESAALLRAAEGAAPGVPVHAVSVRTGEGLEALAARLRPGRTFVLLGSSGVGKSSLVNALAGAELMQTGEIRAEDGRGRHTTTHRQLLRLPGGALVIDTPGMRALGMWDAAEGLSETFADVEQYLGRCRFSDCRHEREPGCVVRAALESGALPRERWESWCRLRGEAAYADDKAAYLRRRQQWHKEVAKRQRQIEKSGGKDRF